MGLTQASALATTGMAQLWRVRQANGAPAVLKIYARADRGNEAAGIALLSAWADRGAVRILAEDGAAVLMEDLKGPSLGDVARGGEPERAVTELAALTERLHRGPRPDLPNLPPLEVVFEPLQQPQFPPGHDPALRRDILHAGEIATHLLTTQPAPCPLHGDLHFDNVILTASSARVIDAKGYLGDPAFELANALRHPRGLPDLVRNADHMYRCAALYVDSMDCDVNRLLAWAAAKCALSILWRGKGTITADDEADLLALMLQLCEPNLQ